MQRRVGGTGASETLTLENRLDIEDRRAVDCLQPVHLQPALVSYVYNLCAMEPNRVGPVRGTRSEHACEWVARISARPHGEGRTLAFMQPGEDPNFVPRPNPVETLHKRGEDLQLRMGRILPALPGSAGPLLDRGANITNWRDFEALRGIHTRRISAPASLTSV